MPSITQLEYIIALDETKSFSGAAKLKNISQPSLSTQIQKVEEELGIVIFDRSQKPMKTTTKGQELISRAKNVIREYKKILDVKNDEEVLTGDFHLGIIPSLASYLLPLFLESFSRDFPRVNLKISEYKTEDILNKLYDDQLDAAILATPLHNDRIIERALFYERFILFTSDEKKYSGKNFVLESELDPNSVWLLEEGHCFREQVIKVCSIKQRKNIFGNINFQSGSLETLINLVRKGHGYTLLPELAVISLTKHEIEHNTKKFKAPIPTREISLIHSRSYLKQDIIDAIESEIIKNLPKEIKSLKRDRIEVVGIL
jgi:LysR family hydrogen peroxide-inducible transcriptional activator